MLIPMSSVALNASQTVGFFHGPIPIISNTDPEIGGDVAARLSADLLSKGDECRFPIADRFSSAAAALARFNKAN